MATGGPGSGSGATRTQARGARLAAARATRAQRQQAAARKPATPIVTEHTRGQAQGGQPDYGTGTQQHGLPADYGQGLTPKTKGAPLIASTFDLGLRDRTALASGPIGVLGKIIANLGQDAEYAPAGVYTAGSGLYKDAKALELHGDPRFSHTTQLAKLMGEQTYESLRHPGRRPGDSILNLLAGVGAVAGGGAARLGAAGAALREGEGLGAVTRAGADGGGLIHKPGARAADVQGRRRRRGDEPCSRPHNTRRCAPPRPSMTRRCSTRSQQPGVAPRPVRELAARERGAGDARLRRAHAEGAGAGACEDRVGSSNQAEQSTGLRAHRRSRRLRRSAIALSREPEGARRKPEGAGEAGQAPDSSVLDRGLAISDGRARATS